MFNQKSNPSSIVRIGLLWLPLFVAQSVSALAQQNDHVDFVKTIKPILEQHCLKCHGEEDAKNFRIDVQDEAMGYIVENSADDSDLYLSLISDDEEVLMPPPKEKNPLTTEEIQLVKSWINQGAEWPADVQFVSTVPPTEDLTPEGDNPAPANAVDPKTKRIFDAIGSLHPAAIHLPIGLLLGAGLFALFSLRGNFVMSDCAYYCLWLGTVGAIIACATGWWASPMAGKGTVNVVDDLWDMKQPVFWHRTSAVVVTVFAFLLGLFAASARNRDPDDGMIWKLGLILLAVGIGFVGHQGGELTHGKHHYDAINAIGAEWFPEVFGKKKAPVEEAPLKIDDPEEDSAKEPPPVGATSEEAKEAT